MFESLNSPAVCAAQVPPPVPAGLLFAPVPGLTGDFSPVEPGQLHGETVGPSTNRGLKGTSRVGIVDWLTFVVSADLLDCKPEHATERDIDALLARLVGITSFAISPVRDRSWNFYPKSCVLIAADGSRAGDVGLGGARGTICVSLSGQGCSHVGDWSKVRAALESVGARLTRVDVAYDDKDGEVFDLQSLIELARSGGFECGGRPPKTGHFDDHGSGRGCTLTVGKKGHKELCIYEKGKQLGDPESPWVRAECRLYGKHVGGSVDFEALTDPLSYLKGSYDVMATLLYGVCSRMTTVRAAVDASVHAMTRWLSTQAGPSLRVLREALGDGFEDFMTAEVYREGDPGRFRGIASGKHLRDLIRAEITGESDIE